MPWRNFSSKKACQPTTLCLSTHTIYFKFSLFYAHPSMGTSLCDIPELLFYIDVYIRTSNSHFSVFSCTIAAAEFAPDITIISAGFDAARGDPLGCCDVRFLLILVAQF